MKNIKILNKKEVKKVLSLIKNQWDADVKLDYVFLQNSKGKIFIANKELFNIDKIKKNKIKKASDSFLENLRINSIGMYFGLLKENQLRLTIEGSQIIGAKAKKNILLLSDAQTKEWLRGEDLPIKNLKGFFLIKNKNDFLGTGKAVKDKILNFVPKNRRVNLI